MWQLLSHAMWSRNTIFMSVTIVSMTCRLFNTALGWFMIHSKRMGCHLQNTRFGQMGVRGSSNRHAHFIGWVAFTKRDLIRHTWSFFETGHGKGEHDGVGACMKQALQRYQMSHSASRLKCSAKVVDWCTQIWVTKVMNKQGECTGTNNNYDWNLINVFVLLYIYKYDVFYSMQVLLGRFPWRCE